MATAKKKSASIKDDPQVVEPTEPEIPGIPEALGQLKKMGVTMLSGFAAVALGLLIKTAETKLQKTLAKLFGKL
jgi:hypothetical protein